MYGDDDVREWGDGIGADGERGVSRRKDGDLLEI